MTLTGLPQLDKAKRSSGVEVPSGKGAADENFPVGSRLLDRRLRPHVAAYYAFARAIDDIADNNILAPGDKIARLTAFGTALCDGTGDHRDFAKAHRLRRALMEKNIDVRRGLDLVDAFRQDATKGRYSDWHDLMHYCDRSAAPVGRFLLDLHGESEAGYPASDALCNALQVLNHLQDCQNDYRDFDRVYLPLDWLGEVGGRVEHLDGSSSTPALRTVIDRCLDGVDGLLDKAAALPRQLNSRRLAMEAAVIIQLANRLSRRLRRADPLAGRVALTKLDFIRCGVVGIATALVSPLRPAETGGHGKDARR